MPDRTFAAMVAGGLVGLAMGLTALDGLVEAQGGAVPGVLTDFLDRLIMLGAGVASTIVILRLSRLRERTDDLENAVRQAAREGRAWRAHSRRFLDGLSRAVEAQFDLWGLTAAEGDVASLLLKGALLREIAGLRRRSEATIRQQAQSVYRKSGLSSRAELSAYFMEDLVALGEATVTGPSREDRYDA